MYNTELVNSLRNIADFLEKTEFDLSNASFGFNELYLFCDNAKSFLNNIKSVGSFTREFNDYYAKVYKTFGNIKFSICADRGSVCERVKVGVEIIPAAAERVIPAEPEKVIDKYEYKCPESLLK